MTAGSYCLGKDYAQAMNYGVLHRVVSILYALASGLEATARSADPVDMLLAEYNFAL